VKRSVKHQAIEQALCRVGGILDEQHLIGEVLLVGGAYMTLALRQR